MTLWDRDRGQAIQIGAVLLFATLIIALSLYQANVVPQTNKEAEFDHNQQVQSQLEDVRNAILRSAGTDSGQPVSVTLGTRYDRRVFAVNPGQPSGTIRSEPLGEMTIQYAKNDDNPYWNNGQLRSYATRALVYQPHYNEYDAAPTTIYEHSILYNQFDDATARAMTNQSVIDGRDISLVFLEGRLNTSEAGSVSISPQPVSAGNEITVTNTTGQQITMTLPTLIPEAECNRLFEQQHVSNGGYVSSYTCTGSDPGSVTFTLKQDETYTLELAEVSLSEYTERPEPVYMVPVEGDDVSVSEGSTVKLTAEVRDQYNNPVTGQWVNYSIDTALSETPSGTLRPPTNVTTNEDGQVTVIYEAPTIPSDQSGNREVKIDADYGSATNRTTFDVTVVDTTQGGGGGGPPPEAADSVTYAGDSTALASGPKIQFDILKEGSETNTVTGFSFSGSAATYLSRSGKEVEIKYDGVDGYADGAYYVAGAENSLTSNALLTPGDRATIITQEYYSASGSKRSFSRIRATDEANANFVFSLYMSDGSVKHFYFYVTIDG